MDGLDCVVFDCDGVLVDAVSSWRTLHDHFGTDNNVNLQRFIAGEFDDLTFMRSDIALWKGVQDPIHQDDLFRAYAEHVDAWCTGVGSRPPGTWRLRGHRICWRGFVRFEHCRHAEG